MRSPQDPLREDEVDNKQQDYSSSNKNVGSYSDGYVGSPIGPYYSHRRSRYTCHAETKHRARDDEFVASSAIHLQDRHVANGSADEEEEEDGCNWNIDGDGGLTSELCGCGEVWRPWRRDLGWLHDCQYLIPLGIGDGGRTALMAMNRSALLYVIIATKSRRGFLVARTSENNNTSLSDDREVNIHP